MYTTTRHEASISVPEYVENYVDVPTFLEACKACPNYDRVWACPSYDFDVLKYWKQYQTFQLLANAMLAGLLVGGIFVVALFLFILFCVTVWFR